MNNQPTPNYTQTTFGQITKKLVNGGTPSTEIAHFWNGKIPWITGADFTTNGIGEFRRFVSETAIAQTATNLIDQGQLLLVTRTGVGKLAIAPCDIAISQDITGVYPDTEKVDVRFLYHRMRLGVEDLKKLNQGTSINGIIRRDLFAYPIQLPALPQQRRIAEILSTLDEAIEQTEALIAKHQQIKAGLMHDLFTRGVAPNGHLRPTREQAPDLYKESPLGWIPKEWKVKSVGDIALKIQDGTHFSPQSKDGPCRYITSKNIRFGYMDIEDCGWISQIEHDAIYKRCDVRFGDVLLTKDGANTGNACLNELHEQFSLLSSVALIRMDGVSAHGDYVLHYLLSPFGQQRLKDLMTGNAITRLTLEKINAFLIPVGDAEEQRKIADRLNAIQLMMLSEENRLQKLHQQKHGLMHDLLTGRVRVAVADAKVGASNG